MAKIIYVSKKFNQASQEIIDQANAIITEYQQAGFDLTLRQLYYQFVARGLLENKKQEYDRLGVLVNNARLAGLIDWHAIVDRTRNVVFQSHWESPEEILDICANTFAVDKWVGQPYRVEVWVEKEALAGVLQSVCPDLDVPYFSCRGYVSQSETWRAAMRLQGYWDQDQQPVVIHLGDHDPSGIDMTRDIEERCARVFGCPMEIRRIALNMDQVEEFKPPPNPAKTTDSRFRSYMNQYGSESWELDALEPQMLAKLIEDTVLEYRNEEKWNEQKKEQDDQRAVLAKISDNFEDVSAWLDGLD